jgi:hypothetical protein
LLRLWLLLLLLLLLLLGPCVRCEAMGGDSDAETNDAAAATNSRSWTGARRGGGRGDVIGAGATACAAAAPAIRPRRPAGWPVALEEV